jgi:uncharacterized protein
MESLILLAFITGLTTGGLSCFAVQGGLITGSIANRVENALQASRIQGKTSKKSAKPKAAAVQMQHLKTGQALLLFMIAKLAAYTLVGFLLGAVGSIFTLTPVLKGLIQVGVGIFVVGNGLRMLDVHPIFRYFSFEPPSRVNRWIRRISKQDEQWTAPLYLGALTVLIPCGVTQSMMAVAIGTGSAWMGAVIMFVFTLGTSPTFFVVTWLAASLGKLFQKSFYRIVAVVILALGLYTVDTGLVVMGSPVSVGGYLQSIARPQTEKQVRAGEPAVIHAENWGYTPGILTLPANQPVELHLVTDETRSCSRAFAIPALNIQQILPVTGNTIFHLPAQASGTSIQFTCTMGMYGGKLVFQ